MSNINSSEKFYLKILLPVENFYSCGYGFSFMALLNNGKKNLLLNKGGKTINSLIRCVHFWFTYN